MISIRGKFRISHRTLLINYSSESFYHQKFHLPNSFGVCNIIIMSSHSGDPIDVANLRSFWPLPKGRYNHHNDMVSLASHWAHIPFKIMLLMKKTCHHHRCCCHRSVQSSKIISMEATHGDIKSLCPCRSAWTPKRTSDHSYVYKIPQIELFFSCYCPVQRYLG